MGAFQLTVGEFVFGGKAVWRGSEALQALLKLIPWSGDAVQDTRGGEVLRLRGPRIDPAALRDAHVSWFMHPGLIGVDLQSGELALCYGQGRLMNGGGPIPMVAVAEVEGDLAAFGDWGAHADSRGPVPARFAPPTEARAPEPAEPEQWTRMRLTLGEATATLQLLEESAPLTSRSFFRKLPLKGTGTNTIFSGPLVRFWNADGGPNGTTPLDERDGQYNAALETHPTARTRAGRGMTVCGEATHGILYPGFVYYLPTRPWRGVRIAATEATRMGSGSLVPFAKFVGDWEEFRDTAANLVETGALPMEFTRIS